MNYLDTNKSTNILNQYIEKVIVINLIEAIERKEKILIELDKIFDKNKIIILEAFKNPYIGATQSHINCLKLAFKNKWKNILILEDDACFTNNCTNLFEKLIQNNFDVLHLGAQNVLFNPFTNRLYACFGGVSYIVNNHYYKVLIRHYEEGLQKIIKIRKILTKKNESIHLIYVFDSYWRTLQIKDNWKVCYPPIFVQKEGYSYVNKNKKDYEIDFYDVNFSFIKKRLYEKNLLESGSKKKLLDLDSIKKLYKHSNIYLSYGFILFFWKVIESNYKIGKFFYIYYKIGKIIYKNFYGKKKAKNGKYIIDIIFYLFFYYILFYTNLFIDTIYDITINTLYIIIISFFHDTIRSTYGIIFGHIKYNID